MAAGMTTIRREFVPGLAMSLTSMTELDRMEAALGAAVAPFRGVTSASRAKWNKRQKLHDRIRIDGKERLSTKLLGNISAKVMDEPHERLMRAITDAQLRRTNDNRFEYPIDVEPDPAVAAMVAKYCVGLEVQADVLSFARKPLGLLRTAVWYVPRLPNLRMKQVKNEDAPMTPDELRVKAVPTRQLLPVTYQPYSGAESEERMRQTDDPSSGAVPSLSLNDVLARAESDQKVRLSIGDVVLFPVAPLPDTIETQWGDPHVVTGLGSSDHAFNASKIMGGDALAEQLARQLPVRKDSAIAWSPTRIAEGLAIGDETVNVADMSAYLARQAVMQRAAAVAMPPLAV